MLDFDLSSSSSTEIGFFLVHLISFLASNSSLYISCGGLFPFLEPDAEFFFAEKFKFGLQYPYFLAGGQQLHLLMDQGLGHHNFHHPINLH
jgi:hypothetical protein